MTQYLLRLRVAVDYLLRLLIPGLVKSCQGQVILRVLFFRVDNKFHEYRAYANIKIKKDEKFKELKMP